MSEQFSSMASAIRQEAQRFEGLHRSINDLYRLLQQIDNIPVKIQMRELVNNIEDCFQHSPEFTVLQPPPDCELKLGVVGSMTSGKSALVHRYLTGECPKEEDLNRCHKKEVIIDGQSYLMLIRNETGSPDFQFVQWLAALVLVFNVNDELSCSVLPGYYARMSQYRDFSDIPLFLVGIKECEANCSVNSNHYSQFKKRLNEANDFTYVEVCLETGESVNKMFQLGLDGPYRGQGNAVYNVVKETRHRSSYYSGYCGRPSSPKNRVRLRLSRLCIFALFVSAAIFLSRVCV